MNNNLIPRPEFPNPIMRRDRWQNLNGEWLFEIDHGSTGTERGLFAVDAGEKYTRKITVPFCPESKLSGVEYKDFMSSIWYKRSFTLSNEEISGRVLLHFGAVDFQSVIYINGEKVDAHYGGYSSFVLDITDFVKPGENDLTVNVKDDLRSYTQPSGKQSVSYYSKGCNYTRTTGIWQTVWLEFVPNGYIQSTKYFPDIAEGAFDMELVLSRSGEITAEVFYDGKLMGTVTKACDRYARLHLPLAEKHLWEVGKGRLYDIKFTFKTEEQTDILYSYAGLREVKIDGLKVRINNKSVFQRTVLDQGFYPDGIYTAPTDEDLKNDIALSMDLGFNGARLHEKIFEPRFLYYCDKAGYLVWGEHANWRLNAHKDIALLNFLPEWCEAIDRDFNHPAIIGWCPLNETWEGNSENYIRFVKALYAETKRLDPTRPVIDTSGMFHVITDIYDQHDYDQDPESFKASYAGYNGQETSFNRFFREKQAFIPNLPLFLSEFGGIKWVPEFERLSSDDNAWGYGDAPKTEEEFFSRYEGLVAALLDNPAVMGFCYTQLYDVEQEVNGLYTYGRKKKFDDYARIIAANTKKAAIED